MPPIHCCRQLLLLISYLLYNIQKTKVPSMLQTKSHIKHSNFHPPPPAPNNGLYTNYKQTSFYPSRHCRKQPSGDGLRPRPAPTSFAPTDKCGQRWGAIPPSAAMQPDDPSRRNRPASKPHTPHTAILPAFR